LKTPLQLLDAFKARFGSAANVYRAPGRVNLIGEHTDYNDGFVLQPRLNSIVGRRRLRAKTASLSSILRISMKRSRPAWIPCRPWGKALANYPLGVAWALRQAGKPITGANLLYRGNVPLGAGLSSSAAVEVAAGFALLNHSSHVVDLAELAQLCQKAENEFVGARVGIMDQFVSCFGRASHALLLDCRSLEHKFVKTSDGRPVGDLNTMVRHELASGEYNARRAECEEGVRILRTVFPEDSRDS